MNGLHVRCLGRQEASFLGASDSWVVAPMFVGDYGV